MIIYIGINGNYEEGNDKPNVQFIVMFLLLCFFVWIYMNNSLTEKQMIKSFMIDFVMEMLYVFGNTFQKQNLFQTVEILMILGC